MKKLFMISFIGILCLSLALVGGCSSAKDTSKPANPTADANKVYELRFTTTMAESEFTSHPAARSIQSFVDNVQKRSNGRVKITLFKGGQLSKNTESDVQGLKGGAFQLSSDALGSMGSYTKAFMPFNLLYLFKNQEVADKFIDSDYGKKMREDALKDTGIRFLAFFDVGFRNVTNSKKEIKTPDDMKGLKIRTMEDPFQLKALQAMGAAPTPLAYSELFSALQQGVVDGQENPLSNIMQAKFYEVQKYLTLTKHSFTINTMIMSESAFQALPQDIQKIILEEARNAEVLSRQYCAEKEKSLLGEISQKMKVYDPTDAELKAFQDKSKDSWTLAKDAIGEQSYNQIIDTVNKISAEVK